MTRRTDPIFEVFDAEDAFRTTPSEEKYSPNECCGEIKTPIWGKPDPAHISTSRVERSNLSIRMGMRRFTRLTNGFSKKIEAHEHALAIYFMHYNFARIHSSLRVSPAMAAGVTDKLWSVDDIVALSKLARRRLRNAALQETRRKRGSK